MLEKSFGLLYYLKQSKNAGTERYVYLRITVNGKSKEFSTKRSWDADRWNQVTGRAIGTKEDARSINYYLDNLVAKVHQTRNEMLAQGKSVSAELLKDVILGEKDSSLTLLNVLRDHNLQIESLIGREYKPRTLKRYQTTYGHLQKFIKAFYKLEDLPMKEVNYEFVEQFTHWLKTDRDCMQNATVKHLTILKKILKISLRKGWLSEDPFVDIKLSMKPVDISCLSKEELSRLFKKELPIQRIAIVRDIFVFSCYTGLAYVDVFNLRRNQIIAGVDGKPWIFTRREKTDTPSRLPILPIALQILDRYKEHPKCIDEGYALPVLSNQKMNAYLKEIADLCSIEKKLTFHIARHTFATTVALSNGMPLETVSKILGHKNIRQTQHYAKVLDTKVSQDMEALEARLSS